MYTLVRERENLNLILIIFKQLYLDLFGALTGTNTLVQSEPGSELKPHHQMQYHSQDTFILRGGGGSYLL